MQQMTKAEAELQPTTPILEREEGQTMAEYALILTGVALVVMAGAAALAGGLNTAFNNIVAAL